MYTIHRRISELILLPTFEERFEYLKLESGVGMETFGFDRYLNQQLYTSMRWRKVRDEVILRDNGCDLGVEDRPIFGKVIIHHINPITKEDIVKQAEHIFDPEFLVCVSHETHNAIHYGDAAKLLKETTERKRGDTCPWKHI